MKFSLLATFAALAAFASALPTDAGFPPKSELAPRANDYPFSGKCNGNGGIDPWNYYRCMYIYPPYP